MENGAIHGNCRVAFDTLLGIIGEWLQGLAGDAPVAARCGWSPRWSLSLWWHDWQILPPPEIRRGCQRR